MAFGWDDALMAISAMMAMNQPKPTGGLFPSIDTSTKVQKGKKPSWLEIGSKIASPMLGMPLGGMVGGMFGMPSGGGSNLFNLISQLAGIGRE